MAPAHDKDSKSCDSKSWRPLGGRDNGRTRTKRVPKGYGNAFVKTNFHEIILIGLPTLELKPRPAAFYWLVPGRIRGLRLHLSPCHRLQAQTVLHRMAE